MRQACFIDRDGVVNELIDRGEYAGGDGRVLRYSAPWRFSEFRLLPRVAEALELLGDLGLTRILVTNQPDITYGRLSLEDHEKIMAETGTLPLDDVYVCPHRWDDGCDCKKPKPGMLLAAARKWDIDLASSFMIGDSYSDVKAGWSAGCRTILIQSSVSQGVVAHFHARDIFDASLLLRWVFQEGYGG